MPTFRYAGNGASKDFLRDVKGLIITTKNTTQTVAACKTLAGWQAMFAPATTAAITGTYVNIDRGFEVKTTAPEMVTSNTGFKEKTKDFPAEFIGYGLISFYDYKTWFAADGKELDFVFVMADGRLMTPLTTAGLQKGFCGRIFVDLDQTPKPGGAEKQKACALTVCFDDVEEMRNFQVITPSFMRKELEALVPVGINIEVVTAYEITGGTVIVKATNRATGTPYVGFTTIAQWEIASISADTGGACTAISITQASLGIYTLTILNSAAKMTGPFEIAANTVVSTHIVYLSNVLNIVTP